ncbi:MAG: hypothetical protein PWP38_2971 [Clostridiales bacterium]|nr:hypothetical protein [Clostridiales bacterium]
MPYLFSYGTLRDHHIQKLLFGSIKPSVPAALNGYEVIADADGFFYLNEAVDSQVMGTLLMVTEKDLLKADQWEEVPVYERSQLSITVKTEDAYAFIRAETIKTDESILKADEGKLDNSILKEAFASKAVDSVIIDAWVYLKASPKAAIAADNTVRDSAGDFKSTFDQFIAIRDFNGNMPFYDDYHFFRLTNAEGHFSQCQSADSPSAGNDLERVSYFEINSGIDDYPLKVMLTIRQMGEAFYGIVFTPVAMMAPERLASLLEANHKVIESAMGVPIEGTSKRCIFTEAMMALPSTVKQFELPFDKPFYERFQMAIKMAAAYLQTVL